MKRVFHKKDRDRGTQTPLEIPKQTASWEKTVAEATGTEEREVNPYLVMVSKVIACTMPGCNTSSSL